MTQNSASITGVGQITAARINPYIEQPGDMSAIATEDWWMVRGVNFGTEGKTAKSVIIKARGNASMILKINDIEADPVAVVDINSGAEDIQTYIIDLNEEINDFKNYLYFVFDNNKDAKVISWQFSNLTADQQKESLPGDVDLDGKVNISDVVAVINTIAKIKEYPNADVSKDNVVNITDVVTVINIIAGK